MFRTDPSWSCSQAVSKPVWYIPLLCVWWKTPDDGQRNCLKHVEFYSKNKFEKLVHLVGFIIRIFHDARSPECQKKNSHISYDTGFVSCIEHYLLVLIFNCEGGAFIHWDGSRHKKQHVMKQPQYRSLLLLSSHNLISDFIVTFTELHVDTFILNNIML